MGCGLPDSKLYLSQIKQNSNYLLLVYSVTTQTRYNAAGEALSATQKQLISQLSATLANKSISTDERSNSSINWTVYTAPAKLTSYSTIPTSSITAANI